MAKATESGPVMFGAMSATTTLESSPPLSMAPDRVVERLQPVTGENRAPLLSIPHRDRELATKARLEAGTEAVVHVRELGVASSLETAAGSQCRAGSVVVVVLAALDRPDPLILARDRLVSSLDIHDAQLPDTERGAGALVRPPVVRAVMCYRVRHPVQRFGRHDLARVAAHLYDAADTAHPFQGR